MPTLSRSDAERLLRFVADAGKIGGDEPFTGELLVELGRLIEADYVTYTEVDHVQRRSLVYLPRPGDEDDDTGELGDEEWDLMREHPICERWRRNGRFAALRMSDVIAPRDFRNHPVYTEFFAPWGIEHELKVRFGSSWHARTFMFGRKAGRDFTTRDRDVLEILTPHLRRLWHAARTQRLLASALEALESGAESETRGIVLLGPRGEVEFVSPPARRLLREFFPDGRRPLPVRVRAWLESQTTEPLVTETNRGTVVVRRTDDALLIEERRSRPELTAREQEVLSWVARGKTNAEIAELLWLAPNTVRKHLENVYAKLEVSTRTAAVARFLGVAEAS